MHQLIPNQTSHVPLKGEYRQPQIGERQGNIRSGILPAMGNNLKILRVAKGWTHDIAAEKMGVSRGQFIKLERGERGLTARTINLAAAAFGVSPAEVLNEPAGEVPNAFAAEPTNFRPPPEFLGDRDLPVYAAAEGGSGHMIVSTDPIDIVQRPWYLRSVKEGYAVLVVGDSMYPAFEPGDMAIVNPRLAPMRGKDAILISGSEERGEFTASIKRMIGWTEKEWKLLQFNPPRGQEREFSLPRREWTKALRVVGKYNG